MSNKTFVFSLGAWVVPSVFDATRSYLESLGFSSACPAHPSIGAEPPSMTLEDDTESLRSVLTAYVDEGRDVIVVAHSYGGVVASSAVEGLSKTARTEAGMLGGNYMPWMKVEGDYVHADGAGDVGWQDIPLESQEKWNSLILHTSRQVFSGESAFEPWKDIPCAYILCENDRALPPPFQELFASKVAGPANTYRLPSSHSPFLSMPDRLAETLRKAAV
ncbi:unnamed protein product [Penicillium pancosmium]